MSEMNHKFKDLMQMIDEFVEARNWGQFHNIKNLSMALCVEASELMEIFQWCTDQKSIDETLLKKKDKIENELADIFYYLLRIASSEQIDLESSLKRKMSQNMQKYPVSKCYGKSNKYNELDL